MSKQAAVVTTWESSVPGREAKAIDAFMDVGRAVGSVHSLVATRPGQIRKAHRAPSISHFSRRTR